MNGTCWSTLSAFVQTLANNGIVEAEETERVMVLGDSDSKGWYITYIRRDDKERRKKQLEMEELKNNMDMEERTLRHFEQEKKRMEQTLDKSKL